MFDYVIIINTARVDKRTRKCILFKIQIYLPIQRHKSHCKSIANDVVTAWQQRAANDDFEGIHV